MSQENVLALLDRIERDDVLRSELSTVGSSEALAELAASLGFDLRPSVAPDTLTDPELDGMPSAATDRTCYGTTDCCHTKRTCFGTTACCR
jgi:hypothetical protein